MIGATRFRMTAEINRQTKLASEANRAQADLSSEKRLRAASDDPAAAARVADIRRKQANETAWSANVETGAAVSASVDGALKLVSTGLDRARELLLAGGTAGASASDRASYAAELRSIVSDFAGYAKQTDSRGLAIFPEDAPLEIPVGRGVSLAATTSRAEAFSGVPVAAGGTADLAAILNAAAGAIALPDGDARKDALATAMKDVESATSHVADVRAEQGRRGRQFDVARERLADSAITLTEERTSLEGTDITTTVALLKAKLLTLDAAQAAFARIHKQTLFDVLG